MSDTRLFSVVMIGVLLVPLAYLGYVRVIDWWVCRRRRRALLGPRS